MTGDLKSKKFTINDDIIFFDSDVFCDFTESNVISILNCYYRENEQLNSQLEYIQSSISKAIKHQKTGLGQKALKEVIADYNEWLIGHKKEE